VDSGADADAIRSAREALLAEQRADGSWAQLANMSGDAYATATALTTLSRAGLDAKHEAYRKGVKYLLNTQNEDGSWNSLFRFRCDLASVRAGVPGCTDRAGPAPWGQRIRRRCGR
jgi:hypothetical protein